MKWEKYIANLGYGSRREVELLIRAGRVTHADGSVFSLGQATTHNDLRVDDEPLDPPPGSVIAMHKPVGYVCSTREASLLIYELLPHRFRERSPVIAPVGRLDRDTSGLLILTDDGQLNHRLTSPRTHLPKMYEVTLASDLNGSERDLFASGTMMLESETEPLKPVLLDVAGSRTARVTLTEGRYHQVRRMFAAVGNHVDALRRISIGALSLGHLAEGEWRVLGSDEISALRNYPAL